MMEEQQQPKTGRIYKISSPQTDNVYIGSTTQDIHKRLQQHIKDYRQYQNGKKYYISSFEIVKYDDVIIEVIEEIEYINKNKLLDRERYFIESIENIVNKYRPITTKEEKKEDMKVYRIENKENIKEKINLNHMIQLLYQI